MVRQALAAQALGAAGTMIGDKPFIPSLSKGERTAKEKGSPDVMPLCFPASHRKAQNKSTFAVFAALR